MASSSISYFLKSLHAKADKEIEKGTELFFNAFVINDNKSQKMLDMESYNSMHKQVNNLVRTEKPEIIKVDILTKNGKWIDGNICDLRAKTSAVKNEGFQGLGEIEINALVERRFLEKQKEEEFKEMKEIVKDLASENEELKTQIETLETEVEDLEQALESKKQVKYYAGLLGDILESIGIKKEKLRKPLAGFLEQSNRNDQKNPGNKEDKSGIVDENKQQENTNTTSGNSDPKRIEVINLIYDFLDNVENQLLGEIFTIFSEIESDKSLAPDILEYIEKRKEFTS